MKYRVIDKITKEDITDEHRWVITPDGQLHALEYCDLIGYPNAAYINALGIDEFNKTADALRNRKPRCHKCVYEMQCSRDKDNEHKCPDYKRDAPDGGFYG